MKDINEAQKVNEVKKDIPWWLLGVVALVLYVVNLVVLAYFTISSIRTNPDMLIIFLVGLITTTLLTGLVCYAMISMYKGIQSAKGEVIKKDEQTTDVQTYLKILSSLLRVSTLHSQHMEISKLLANIVKIVRESLNADQVSLMLLSIFGEDIAMTIENATLTRELKKNKTFSELGLKENDNISVTPVPRMSDTRKMAALRQSSQNIATQKIKDNIMSVSVKGTLDYVIGEELEKSIQGFIDHGIYRFVIDLADVDRISSEGIGIFTSFISTIQKKQGSMVLVQPNHQVKTALNLFGLQEFFPIAEDLSSGLKALGSR